MRVVRQADGLPFPLYHEGANLLHWPILKNAHSSLTDRLKGKPFLFGRWLREPELPVGAVSFAVWRDPFDRYVSGLAQMWRQGAVADVEWSVFVDGVEGFNRRTSSPWTCRGDRHFIPQVRTWHRMGDRRVLFRMDDLGEVWQWLALHGPWPVCDMDWQKPTDPWMRRYAEQALTRGIIDRHYSADLALWRRVEFDGVVELTPDAAL